MAFGLTDTGFIKKRLEDILAEIDTSLRATLGSNVNLLPTSLVGQVRAIFAEREALLWDLLEELYNSQFIDTADGVSLDNALSFIGLTRKAATKSTVTLRIFGDVGIVVSAGFTASVQGTTNRFVTIEGGTIGAGINEQQTITFDGAPSAGSFALTFDGQTTGAISWDANAAAVQTALNNLSNLSAVTVTGDFASGFVVTFGGADGQQDQPMLAATNNLTGTTTISVAEAVKGYSPFVDVAAEAEVPGAIAANAGTITEIATPQFGVSGVTNVLDAVAGTNRETDAEIRLRRLEFIGQSGTGTVDKIRASLLAISGVQRAFVVENTTEAVDGDGRPPKSFECYVSGGDDQEIGQVVWDTKPAGIQAYGSEPVTLTDSQGFTHTVYFSRPVPRDIYLVVNITKNTDPAVGTIYPSNGDDLVRQAVLDFAQSYYDIGRDVINNLWYTPINTIDGVIGIQVLQGLSPAPASSANITISTFETPVFDSSRIEVNS